LSSNGAVVSGFLDKANNRSSHKGVVLKGGGIGILAAFLLASWVLGLPILFWVCAGLVSLLSLYGDCREISPKVRLGIQLLGSVGLLFGLFYWEGRGISVYLLITFFCLYLLQERQTIITSWTELTELPGLPVL